MPAPRGKTVYLAMVGCGGIAGAHLRGYSELLARGENRLRIVAAVDDDADRAEDFAHRIEAVTGEPATPYTSVDDLLDGEKRLNAADICAPHGLHHVLGCRLLDAKVNVLIEKPIGITVKATKKIIAAAKKNRRIAANAEQCRRAVGQRTIHWAFHSGLVGEPRMWYGVGYNWQDPADVPNWHWRVDRKLGGCGMVMDSGAHWVDTMRYFFGEVDSVYARVEQVEKRPHRKGKRTVNDTREDFWTSIFNFKNGVVGTWTWTISAPGSKFSQASFTGSKGTIVESDVFHPAAGAARGKCHLVDGTSYTLEKVQDMYLKSLSRKEKDRLFPYGITAGMPIELWDFVDAVSRGRKVEIDAEEGLKSKAVSEAIYESGKAGTVVKVADVISGKVNAWQKDIDRAWKL